MARRENGVILWEGRSRYDGSPIVVIATGLRRASQNGKTGDMVQVFILRADMEPLQAIRTGADSAICGACPLRGDGTGGERGCYVNVSQSPTSVYRTFVAGGYRRVSWSHAARLIRASGKAVRLGAYGDPALLPLPLVRLFARVATGSTGYTHAWRSIDPGYSGVLMASADTVQDRRDARAMGYRSFYVAPVGESLQGNGAMLCSAERERNPLQCSECLACGGTRGGTVSGVDVAIMAHGVGARYVGV